MTSNEPGPMTTTPAGGPRWLRGASIELVDGYPLVDRVGASVLSVHDVSVAIEGGFAHVDVPGAATIQVLSAPAVRRITYPADPAGR